MQPSLYVDEVYDALRAEPAVWFALNVSEEADRTDMMRLARAMAYTHRPPFPLVAAWVGLGDGRPAVVRGTPLFVELFDALLAPRGPLVKHGQVAAVRAAFRCLALRVPALALGAVLGLWLPLAAQGDVPCPRKHCPGQGLCEGCRVPRDLPLRLATWCARHDEALFPRSVAYLVSALPEPEEKRKATKRARVC